MASNSTISISFRIDEAGGFKKLTVDAEGLRRVMQSTVSTTTELEKEMQDFSSLCMCIDSVNTSLQKVQNVLTGLSDAYAAQVEAETQLAVNMRNTMGAREADIQSIKDLCSAQQQLGVIGDEVQLSGAQELATYLTRKESLEKLIPVMNDMLAQQYGLNATQENAAQIATMLGKVMDGQTGALSRYGYSFDEAQEKILKFGTESERAAVLCDVVTSSVGGMNAELAKTDVGKLKQQANEFGDWMERIGGLVQGVLPDITRATQLVSGLAQVLKIGRAAYVGASAAVKKFNLTQTVMRRLMIMGTGSIKKGTAAMTVYSTAAKGSAAASVALKIALRGLLISTGIGVALTALGLIIDKLSKTEDDATDSTNRLLDAEARAKRDAEQMEQLRQHEVSTLESTRSALQLNITKLKEFNGTKAEEEKLVGEMNDTYGDTMRYFSSVSDWYKALIENSEDYCRQMVLEARARRLADQIAAKEQENYDILYDEYGNKRHYDPTRQTEQVEVDPWYPGKPDGKSGGGLFGVNPYTVISQGMAPSFEAQKVYKTVEIEGTSKLDKAQAAYDSNNKAIANFKKQMTDAVAEANSITFKVTGSRTRPTTAPSGGASDKTEQTRLQEISKEREELKKRWHSATESERGEIESKIEELNVEEAKLRDIEARLDSLGKKEKPKEKSAVELKVEKRGNDIGIADELDTLSDVNEALDLYREKQSHAKDAEIADTQRVIDKLLERERVLRRGIDIVDLEREVSEITALSPIEQEIRLKLMGEEKIKATIAAIRSMLDDDKNPVGDSLKASLEKLLPIYQGFLDKQKEQKDTSAEVAQGLSGTGEIMGSLGEAIGGTAGEWLKYGQSILSAVATAIPAILAITTAKEAQGQAEAKEAAAGAASSVASIPVVGAIMAVAAVASVVAALASIPKFAKGGIISGPTIGLMGEYAGASHNPEVVAPLDRLRSLINPPATAAVGGEFRVSGRDLVCVLANETRVSSRSGRKSNIRL
ncbi:MAG: hypothetical protein NC117_02720 [Pseudoflavonifractor sp.]|nr:hypothetical protein [Pseudoflavonifractor sp.]